MSKLRRKSQIWHSFPATLMRALSHTVWSLWFWWENKWCRRIKDIRRRLRGHDLYLSTVWRWNLKHRQCRSRFLQFPRSLHDSLQQNQSRKSTNYIIPFQKTKEQCKEAYARRMKHSIFAPKELRDPSYIDSFRGIYMPYWAFYISQKGSLSLDGKRLPAAVIILLPITTHLPGIWMPTTKVFPMMPHPLLMTISVKNWLLII